MTCLVVPSIVNTPCKSGSILDLYDTVTQIIYCEIFIKNEGGWILFVKRQRRSFLTLLPTNLRLSKNLKASTTNFGTRFGWISCSFLCSNDQKWFFLYAEICITLVMLPLANPHGNGSILSKFKRFFLRKREKGLSIACPTYRTYLRYPWYVHHSTHQDTGRWCGGTTAPATVALLGRRKVAAEPRFRWPPWRSLQKRVPMLQPQRWC